jgi:hypothetical protein
MIANARTWHVIRILPDGTRKLMLRDTERQARQAVAYCLVDNGILHKTDAARWTQCLPAGEDGTVGGYTFRIGKGQPA